MASKYRRLIDEYCARHGVNIPQGFAQGTPQRYAIIRTHLTPPKLIARTWFSMADVVYYIEHFMLTELGDTLSQSSGFLTSKTARSLRTLVASASTEWGHF